MGRFACALSWLILLGSLFTVLPCSGEDIGMHARIRTFMMPQYHEKDERLQFIVYGSGANNKGALLFLTDMVVDFIRNDLRDAKQVKLIPEIAWYELSTPTAEITRYWTQIPHSQGLIFCETATLDKTTKILRSDKPVKFRSAFLDVDGVGFDAYQEKRLLHIRSNVKLQLRTGYTRGKGKRGASGPRRPASDYIKSE